MRFHAVIKPYASHLDKRMLGLRGRKMLNLLRTVLPFQKTK
jgi:hypothetical protein